MENCVNDIAFEAIYFYDDTMEGGIKDFVTSVIRRVKEWWVNKALPFIKGIARKVAEFFSNLVKSAAKVPKGIWKYIVQLGGKFKSFFDKRANDAIVVDDEVFEIPDDAIAGVESTGIESFTDLLFNDHGISMEAQIKNNANTVSENIFGEDIPSVEKAIEYFDKKFGSSDQDTVSEKELKDEAEKATKAISGTIEKFAKSNEKAYKNLENAIKNDEDANTASKKANHWMSKVSAFFKSIADFFSQFFSSVKNAVKGNKA